MTASVESDRACMQRALRLAERGRGHVHPNPMVGAVVVRDGAVLAEGWHAAYGGPHAEVAALLAAGDGAQGATLYVTLEPCAHHGKTPPCVDAITAAGIARVVYAAADPNRRAAGGHAELAARGVAVEGGLLAEQARRMDAAFFHAHTHATPWVALKLAVSLDGSIARKPGERTLLTGAEAVAWVHELRSGFDALMIGASTARVDDPQLTVRGATSPRIPPVRVVVDTMAALRPESVLVATARQIPTWVVAGPDAPPARVRGLTDAGVRVVQVPTGPRGIDPSAAVLSLWREGVRSILCEGGGRWAGSLLAAGLVHRIYLLVAPLTLGEAGVSAFPDGLRGSWQTREAGTLGGDGLLVLEPVG